MSNQGSGFLEFLEGDVGSPFYVQSLQEQRKILTRCALSGVVPTEPEGECPLYFFDHDRSQNKLEK